MSDTSPQSISGYVNFRDLGGHHTPDGPVRSGRVYRSDSLAHVNAADVEHLVDERGVRTVVDLRGVTEVDAYPNHPMREAGATIEHVPLIDPAKREESGFEWETICFDVTPVSYAQMGLLPQFTRNERDIYANIGLLLVAVHSVESLSQVA